MTRPVLRATLLAAAVALLAACSRKPPPPPPPLAKVPDGAVVQAYLGTHSMSSPDGATPYGEPGQVAVRRVIDAKGGVILEEVVWPGEAFPTTLTRTGTTAVFDAKDLAGTFTGTVTFSGPEWHWNAWTYAIDMADGSGKLTGTGQIAADGTMTTDKLFVGSDGTPKARLRETLAPLPAASFEAERARLLALPRGGP
ncbi:MAG: hypothetical protein U1F43_08805 [Myxococcota bacterium]